MSKLVRVFLPWGGGDVEVELGVERLEREGLLFRGEYEDERLGGWPVEGAATMVGILGGRVVFVVNLEVEFALLGSRLDGCSS